MGKKIFENDLWLGAAECPFSTGKVKIHIGPEMMGDPAGTSIFNGRYNGPDNLFGSIILGFDLPDFLGITQKGIKP